MTQQTQNPKTIPAIKDQKNKPAIPKKNDPKEVKQDALKEEQIKKPEPKPPKVTKKAMDEKLLKQEGGVTIEEVAEKTSWQHHTIRGHFSTIKKNGFNIDSKQIDGLRKYFLK